MGRLAFWSYWLSWLILRWRTSKVSSGSTPDARYQYGPGQVGSVLMVVGLVSTLVQMLLTGPATRRLGEATVIKLSLIASALGFVLMALTVRGSWVFLSVGFFVFSNAMLRPAIMSLTSKLSTGGQGMALGINNSFQSLGRAAGPLWAGSTFDMYINLPYLSAAVIMLGAFIYALWSMRLGQIGYARGSMAGVAPAEVPASED